VRRPGLDRQPETRDTVSTPETQPQRRTRAVDQRHHATTADSEAASRKPRHRPRREEWHTSRSLPSASYAHLRRKRMAFTAAIPLLAMSTLRITRLPPSRPTYSSSDAKRDVVVSS
jgi:hypothetical protein